MGILKGKIRSWSLPQLLLITALLSMHNCIMNSYYNCYISNKGLLEVAIGRKYGSILGCYHSLFKKKTVKRFVQCHLLVRSPPGRRPSDNIQSTLRTATGLCQNVSHAVLFGSNGNSHTVSTQSDMCLCIYTYILRNTEMLVSECSVLRNSFQMPFWEHVPKVRQSLSRPKEMPTQPPV